MTTKTSTADLIYERLEAMIADGRFKDGERLDEVSLAREFGVSRTPLRQALQLLSSSGLAVFHPNRGTFARTPDFVRLVEMFEVMAELEAWCAKLAAQRITTAQVMLLRQAALRCDRALSIQDYRQYYQENETFHGIIYDATGNGFLAEETRDMQRRLRPFRQAQLTVADRLTSSMKEHRQVLEALEAHDARKAETVMREHIRIQSMTYKQLRN
ncbi:DNA-binding transcriptional regulator, GntR family [Rhizobium mongolense subsp. loessense]|uniref:DNA-binding transcriptional regulator, GntR family n=1 Tax=Rhizobium mongolense subsp. loessense TaxID=158890 RepID=A0A1G4S9Z1_9HYPH|nr:GntR family transcriptional regulator [Rhizobium mongolense]SCW65777.1 DNA-binding transcriptional regulator, GntR family [Rhizobium mongolense subsp. loessense]